MKRGKFDLPMPGWLARRLSEDQEGQSLTELALIMPIGVMILLIAVNLGLALHAHLGLTQVTQQAAQYLINHPADADTCTVDGYATYEECTAATVATYLRTHGFDNAGVDVAFSQTSTGVQQATISVSYPFPVTVPVGDTLNLGPFHNGTLALGARAATIAATEAPQIASVTAVYSGTQFTGLQITWSAPANPASVALRYRVYAFNQAITPNGSLPTTTTYYDACGPGGTSPVPCSPSYYSYQVSAVQPDGLESPLSAVAERSS